MFRDAYEIACQFTEPVIDFWQTAEGNCNAGVAACVIINSEGWIVTAAHLVNQAAQFAKFEHDTRQWENQRAAVRADTTINAKERSRRFDALGKMKKGGIRRATTAWGHHASKIADISVIDEIDLAVGRLEPFQSDWVSRYPVFKDPKKDFRRGASLCKLGFPFIKIKPTYDETKNIFDVPPEMRQLAFFPIDGIFTRTIDIPSSTQRKYPLSFVETSSPGLRGQSGGPTFDTKGTLWAIQSRTAHQPLDFSPEIVDGGQKHKEHQFLNIGWGVHVETVLGLLNEVGIKHQVSDY